MKKLSNHIILSGITVSMLFSPLMALPSGGKFTHGTSGTINKPNDNTLNINGHGTNSVIQWGGGFSIGKGESVNFGGNSKNYLNIAHGTSKSTIEGVLNAKGNNVFLINPNGVIITKTGTINANRFVASTSSMSDGDIQKFTKMQKFDDGLTFSPVFKPQKAGNVVNMGNINANNVLLIGNKVLLYGTFDIENKTFNQIAALDKDKKTNIYLVGNETHADIATLNNIDKLHITAKNEGSLYLGATGYYYNPSSFKDFNYEQQDYDNVLNETGNKIEVKHNNEKFLNNKFIGISSDVDWWHFAKGWNENKSDFSKNIEYRLTNNINFKGNQGKGEEGKDWQNYANYCIDGLGCTSMMIGDNKNPFTKTFDGQGFTLKNINIEANNKNYVGIFGNLSNGANIKNFNVDYMNGNVKANTTNSILYTGGVVGLIEQDAKVEDIVLKNINEIIGNGKDYAYVGGFVGDIVDVANIDSLPMIKKGKKYELPSIQSSKFKNITILNINGIQAEGIQTSRVGGFSGAVYSSPLSQNSRYDFNNIFLNHIGYIGAVTDKASAKSGGFVGEIINVYKENNTPTYNSFTDISLNDIGLIQSYNKGTYDHYLKSSHDFEQDDSFASGFAASASGGNYFTGITLNNIKTIQSISKDKAELSYASGFISHSGSNYFNDIILNDIQNIISEGTGHNKNGATIATGFVSFYNPSYFYDIYAFFNSKSQIQSIAPKNEEKTIVGYFDIGGKDKDDKSHHNIHVWMPKDILNGKHSPDKKSSIDIKEYSDQTQAYKEYKQKLLEYSSKQFLKDNHNYLTFALNEKKDELKEALELDLNAILNKEAMLFKDDSFQSSIENYAINDIASQYYRFYISSLDDMLKEKDYKQMSEDEKIDFVSKYFLKDNENNKEEALKIVQSLEFIDAYQENGLKGANKEKIYQNETFEKLLDNTANVISKKDFIFALLKKDLKDFLDKSIILTNQLQEIKTKIQENEREYNALASSENIDFKKINILAENISKLNQQQKDIVSQLDISPIKNKIEYTISKGGFEIIGDVKQDIYTPKLAQLALQHAKKEIPWTELQPSAPVKKEKSKKDLPFIENNIYLSTSDNLKSDGGLVIKKIRKEKDVDKAVTRKRAVTCIVNDGFKTMNPCVVSDI
ncbi:filamentous hemagglutinin N-terminal domain-containing protein [Campylobacter sp. CNRCH_2013_0898h]|uniref:two-partner secretion domain-containing protein n=1 Tax=Campylobacter sp. CNRCH_2013_0898h TaxID=2911601 RepID=UPI0021E66C46|nr:filamentous hemagglutinin N-terminal domain-containing protein [Campylobacter sp. CNRCH_2013_0898h]MCV3552881.1 filamentous hemagglutinin N-terminal domain-containing protein [Campylobacter sp. CNRCH_2013_0898h]